MKKALGKGLSALIPDTYKEKQEEKKAAETTPAAAQPSKQKATAASQEASKNTGYTELPIDFVTPNPDQPRDHFAPEALEELAASIREKGILQPVIVKKEGEKDYLLICGERRYRAAKLCGLEKIPVVIKDFASEEILELALIENIQREDLNAIEEALAYQRLSEERKMSQEEIAKRVGKDRSTITNMMRLLRLPVEVRAALAEGRLSSGHARALLSLMTPEHQRQLANKIIEENLTVRQVEAIVTRSSGQKRRAKKARNLVPEIVDLETRLSHHLGTQVKIHPRKNKDQGRLEIQYFSLDDLDRILNKVGLSRG